MKKLTLLFAFGCAFTAAVIRTVECILDFNWFVFGMSVLAWFIVVGYFLIISKYIDTKTAKAPCKQIKKRTDAKLNVDKSKELSNIITEQNNGE